MIKDAKIGWPARLSLGPDGLGPAPEHIAHIMGQSMEALIHHFKLVTEGFRVPAGQAYVAVESARGELGAHVVSDGTTRPYRVHFRDPSFTNLQSVAALCEGGQVADVIPADREHRPGDGGRGQVMPFSDDVLARLDADAGQIISKYPRPRSALLPLLHLVQSEEGYVSADGIAYCAAKFGLTEAEVTAVVSFYTMYKRHPVGDYHVGVCTNTLCAIMGGDQILAELAEHLGVGNDETTPDGKVTLEHVECNAACDYAPVVMVNWEFFDNRPRTRPSSSSTTCAPGTRSARPGAPTACAPGARPPGSWPASATARPPRARRPGRPAWSASSWPRSTAGPRPDPSDASGDAHPYAGAGSSAGSGPTGSGVSHADSANPRPGPA